MRRGSSGACVSGFEARVKVEIVTIATMNVAPAQINAVSKMCTAAKTMIEVNSAAMPHKISVDAIDTGLRCFLVFAIALPSLVLSSHA